MKRFLTYMTMPAAAAVLIAGLVASSAHVARAQGYSSAGGNAYAGALTTKLTKSPPLDFEGCWDGTGTEGSLNDDNFGTGFGWIGIVQGGKSIKGGHDSFYEFIWDDGGLSNPPAFAYGPIKGKATSTGFTAGGKVIGSCKVTMAGHPGVSDDIVGTYTYTGCTPSKDNGFFDTSGTFDLPLNNSGCVFIKNP